MWRAFRHVEDPGRPGRSAPHPRSRRSFVNRAVARRLAAVVSATVLAGGAVALIAPSAQAAQVVTVLSQSHFVDSAGTDDIVGEVRNDGTTNVEQVTLSFQFLNAANAVLGSDSTNAMVE